MKHSIRFIQFNYSDKGDGTTILVLRGMVVREYKYRVSRFDAFMYVRNPWEWDSDNSSPRYLSFSRIYPK